jgi:flagellar biosynthesis protein
VNGRDELRRAAALAYDGQTAPRVVAGGSGILADEIEALARLHGIPIIQDPRLSSALSAVPLGDEIPAQLYVSVATVLAYVFKVAGRQPGDPGDPTAANATRE